MKRMYRSPVLLMVSFFARREDFERIYNGLNGLNGFSGSDSMPFRLIRLIRCISLLRPHLVAAIGRAVLLLLIVVAHVAAAQTPKPGWDPTTFKKPSESELKKMLTPTQYNVTQQESTEAPFH